MPEAQDPGATARVTAASGRPDATRVSGSFIVLYALSYTGTVLLFLAPLLVSLSLKVNALVGTHRAPTSLSLVAGTGAFIAMFANPFFGRLSDRTTSRTTTWLEGAPVTQLRPVGTGWSRKASCVMTPRVPKEPLSSLPKS